jgi:transposase
MICQNCNNTTFYTLANDYIKCKTCAKKYSLKKLQKDNLIIIQFCENKNALKISKELELNYKTVKDRFDIFRKKIALFLEHEYNNSIHDYNEYEEFYYIKEREKKKKKKSLSESINIMGFYSNKKVYTLLMPKIGRRAFDIEDGFIQYLNWNKIHSLNSHQTNLNIFWKFLEDNLKKYKGFEEDNFFYYLKESEFKFNYTKDEQIEILRNL